MRVAGQLPSGEASVSASAVGGQVRRNSQAALLWLMYRNMGRQGLRKAENGGE